jgi:hypothetical protein
MIGEKILLETGFWRSTDSGQQQREEVDLSGGTGEDT